MARSPRLTPAPPRLRRGGVAFLAAGLLLATTGCGSDSEGKVATPTTGVRSTTTVEPPTTTTTPPTPEQQVKTAYLAAVATYYEVARNPDPDDPALAKTRSGPSLKRVRELFAGFQKAGTKVEYVHDQPPVPVVSSVKVTSTTTAFVAACLVDDAHQVHSADGSVVDDTVVSWFDLAEMRLVAGTWHLHTLDGVQSWKDGAGCDR